jgi:transposase-like protein
VSLKRNDPTLPERARQMMQAGHSWTAICRELGIARSTLNWYRKRAERSPRRLYTCPVCGTRSTSQQGHDHHAEVLCR